MSRAVGSPEQLCPAVLAAGEWFLEPGCASVATPARYGSVGHLVVLHARHITAVQSYVPVPGLLVVPVVVAVLVRPVRARVRQRCSAVPRRGTSLRILTALVVSLRMYTFWKYMVVTRKIV